MKNVYVSRLDGLRAVAVISVVIYHYWPKILPQGFIGVDIFFVISGFVIQRGLEQGSYKSLIHFYQRRILRIAPPVILVVLTALLFGYLFLFDYEYRLLTTSGIASLLFSQNFLLMKEVSYFDVSTISKPLIHFWSLAVEEQFYLIWPILFMFLPKRIWVFRILIIFVLTGPFFSIFFNNTNPTWIFYSPITRFWEIAFGILIARAQVTNMIKKSNSYFSLVGMVMIGIFLFWDTRFVLWPNLYSTIPVIGAGLICAYSNPITEKVLANKVFIMLGKMSFSIYLWHWLFLSFAHVFDPTFSQFWLRPILLVLTLSISFVSYLFIESRVRKIRNLRLPVILTATLYLILVTSLVIIHQQLPAFTRSQQAIEVTKRPINIVNPIFISGKSQGHNVQLDESCPVSMKKHKLTYLCNSIASDFRVAVVGDSKALALFPSFLRMSPNPEKFIFIGGGISPIVPVIKNNPLYEIDQLLALQSQEIILKTKTISDVIIVAATRNLFKLDSDSDINDLQKTRLENVVFEGFKAYINPILRSGKRITIVRDNPTLLDPLVCLKVKTPFRLMNYAFTGVKENPGCSIKLSEFLKKDKIYTDLLLKIAAIDKENIKLVDLTSLYCESEKDLCSQIKFGHRIYSYTDHISEYFADLAAPIIFSKMDDKT
jgi:peptidoglycan/LPS O-acetylase OafA/YrhL